MSVFTKLKKNKTYNMYNRILFFFNLSLCKVYLVKL